MRPASSQFTTRSAAFALILGSCPLVAGCAEDQPETDTEVEVEPDSDFHVEVEINHEVDFSQYTSFNIVDPTLAIAGNPPPEFLEVQAELTDAIVAELRAQGLTRDTESPQLLINPLVNLEVEISLEDFYDAYYGSYWGYDYFWTVEYDYSLGSLLLDVVDRGDPEDVEDDLLVFRGAAHGMLAADIEVIEAQLEPVTREIFGRWPS